jgi:hypothetical protein
LPFLWSRYQSEIGLSHSSLWEYYYIGRYFNWSWCQCCNG